jgi:lysophospholipase L1-like esterase
MRAQYLLILLLFSLSGGCSLEQKYSAFKNTFEQDIQALEQLRDFEEKEDYLLFVGSSSIRRWNSIEADMAPYAVVKRGYGGAHYYDLIHYVDRLVKNKSAAKAVIIFVANDITGPNDWDKIHQDLTPREVKTLFKAVAKKIHKQLGGETPIFVIETTPTPSRWHVWDQISTANDLIQEFTEKQVNLNFISTRNEFFNKRGVPKGKYFVKDSLHLSEAGYDLWEEIIKDALNKQLK